MLVLVTGTSKGIGLEIVKQLSQNPANVIIAVSRNIGDLSDYVKKHKRNNIRVIKADITNSTQRKNIVSEIKKQKIPLDILVNNAGVLLNKPFEKITVNELQFIYNTNVFAPYQLIQEMLPLLNKKAKSHIVNISSIGGFQGSSKFAGLSAYSSSKAALCGLTECLAEEFKNKNIAVNCLALGAVQTEMLSKAFPGYKAPVTAKQMAEFICEFAVTGHKYFSGKILPVSLSTP